MEALAKDQSHVAVLTENSGPVGGRQTDIGTIPDGWDVQPLSQLLDFQNGFNADKSSYGSGVPFANVLEVITRDRLTEADIPGRVTVNASQLQAFLVRPGDILFNRTSETQDELGLASVYVGNAQIIFGGFVIRGRIKSNRLNAICAGYLLRAPSVRRQIVARGQGVVRANIGQSELGSVMVPLPPTHEQTAIAEALADTDGLIEELEQVVLKKRKIKQGTMQDLLSGQKRLPGFKAKWTQAYLGELCTLKSGDGITSRSIDKQSPYPCYGGNGLRGYTRTYTHDGRYALIGRVGALCGNVNLVAGRFFASEHAIVATPNEGISVDWLALLLESMKLNRFSEASAQPVLTVKKLEKLEVLTPGSKDEQAEIAHVVADMTTEIDALEFKLVKARQIKLSMMQELLTGRVRLV
ncbi:restriction endonuclease subunit S [Sinirhodobacter populi]|uniref:Restriction endonuclease subunit S n=1 Tax=Paenirhodobacter populi TaxID=2306993 RepID=A0A443KGU2_9RHOB|nr:restriction endonuclease subunit S [Sinirhodobacter populi]RWR31981.1 restriction endonuclease subunit S [Sinirhodobacter populi]